jgi:hypothetical protein
MSDRETEYHLEAEIARLTRENDCLRAIAAKIMPCHYCGVDEVAKCPRGFPGCALMDDYQGGEDMMVTEIQRLRKTNETLVQSIQQLVRANHRLQELIDGRSWNG